MASWKDNLVIHHLWAIFIIIEMIILWFFSPPPSLLPIRLLEYFFWPIWIPAIILVAIPFYIFRKKGGVRKGESYVKTQNLVDSGVYRIIRHPQYTGGIWISIAMVLPNQSRVIIILAALVVFSFGLTIFLEEESLIEKFGEEYRNYKKRTSSCSFLLGLSKLSIYKKNQN